MLSIATRAGMAFLSTHRLPAPYDHLEHHDGLFVSNPLSSTFSQGQGVVWESYLDGVVPLRIAARVLHGVRSECPACMRESMRNHLVGAEVYFNSCYSCQLDYVVLRYADERLKPLIPYLSQSHYLHDLVYSGKITL